MSDYRFYTIEPVAGTLVTELPLYGIYMDKQLNGAGNFTGTYRLGTDYNLDSLLLNGTIPGRYGIVCKRDNVPIWAGMIWSRTYNSQAQTVQLTAQTFESIFSRMMLTVDYDYQTTEQVTVFTNFITALQGQLSGAHNFNLTMSPVLAATGVTRSVKIPASANQMASDFIAKLINQNNGLNYSINYTVTGTSDTITKQIALNSNASIPASSDNLYFDYPGSINQYWFTESGGALRHVAKGAGPLVASADSSGLTGWPLFHEVIQYTDIQDATILQARASEDAIRRKPPRPTPIFELGANQAFNGWNDLGKMVQVRIQDNRFPNVKLIQTRLKGWSLNPESSDEAEVVRLELEDDS